MSAEIQHEDAGKAKAEQGAKKQREAELAARYARVFLGDEGRPVFDDLAARFGLVSGVFSPATRDNEGRFDPLAAAHRDGQRQVLLHIAAQLRVGAPGQGLQLPTL